MRAIAAQPPRRLQLSFQLKFSVREEKGAGHLRVSVLKRQLAYKVASRVPIAPYNFAIFQRTRLDRPASSDSRNRLSSFMRLRKVRTYASVVARS